MLSTLNGNLNFLWIAYSWFTFTSPLWRDVSFSFDLQEFFYGETPLPPRSLLTMWQTSTPRLVHWLTGLLSWPPCSSFINHASPVPTAHGTGQPLPHSPLPPESQPQQAAHVFPNLFEYTCFNYLLNMKPVKCKWEKIIVSVKIEINALDRLTKGR